jgi:ferric-dicitrate binding protein FerR (iron transport regulator)
MMTCEICRDLIEKCLDGMITDDELSALQKHTQACPACRAQFDRSTFMEAAVKHAFSSGTSAQEAGASLVTRLSAEVKCTPFARRPIVFFAGKRAAVAAGILLAAGIFLGFALDKGGVPSAVPLKAEVPIRVGDIKGTVLVRHEGSDVWQPLETDSKVRLGDMFHSAAKSTCVLKLDDQSTIDLNQNSMLVLESFNGETQFRLEHGELDATLESPHPPFFIRTPNGRLEALGTEFTVTVTDE